jgi:hypothetical protein
MARALVLSLIILSTVAASLPLGDALVEAARRANATQTQNARQRRHRSRAWRRRQRARLRRQRALAAERRRRRWSIRRRRTIALRRNATPRVTLPEMLKQMELSSASPSILDSASVIAEEVSAPPQLIAPPKVAPLAIASVNEATPRAQAATTPQLAHAPQPALASQNAPVRQQPVAPRASAATAPPLSFTRTPAPAIAPPASAPANAPLARPTPAPFAKAIATASNVNAPTPTVRDPRKFSALPVPQNWQSVSSSLGGEFKFSLRASDGRPSGVAVWSRVNLAASANVDRRNRALAGVSHASLRRTVIDRMLVEGGWVVNDFEREVAGQKVFVVVAQSEQGGARRSWAYYFVEVNGQLFSLTTTAPAEFAASVASDAEQTLAAIASRQRPAAAAAHN